MGLSSNKNYVTSNAVEAILSKPGKVAQEGFQWTTRPGYGEVPMYLKQNQLTIRREKESFEEYVKMRSQPVRACAVCSMIRSLNLGCAEYGAGRVCSILGIQVLYRLIGTHTWRHAQPAQDPWTHTSSMCRMRVSSILGIIIIIYGEA